MKKMFSLLFLMSILIMVFGQDNIQHDELLYKDKVNGFYQDSIQASITKYNDKQNKEEQGKYLSVDFSEYDFPVNIKDYNKQWHNTPLSQGASGTCWCFAGISFLESELYRQYGIQIKLSEMYVVYWEYVAKAKYFVKNKGNMNLGQGSEVNAVTRIIKDHGIVPTSEYSGKLKGQRYFDHKKLSTEIKSYLNAVKENNAWNSQTVEATVRSILDQYMTKPPETFIFKGKEYTPTDFRDNVLMLNPDDYFCFMSTKALNYNQKGEMEHPDNWWHNQDYYNVNLTDFISLMKTSLKEGKTFGFCGDVSEPGYNKYAEVGIIPTFDIPPEYINEDSREFRVNNKSTTDDHCLHVIGYTEKDGATWFLIKDSSSSGFDGPNKGYRFIHEDYARLKVLTVMMHKYAAKDVLDKIIK